ncbi:tannase/feruloyl esterase family alpha/beta hydrolase [Hydrogenophaga sp. OTU3427]|uniref:tannase/feruloyl esterase family alpha/beta hydrolase n=1 Tax=Hydrogenophaga sp. OTU3427 TaxID=3043856 RepID=UPI00313E55B6
MPTSSLQPVRLGALAAATTLLVACGGGGDAPPQLAAATGASFTGACAGLQTALASLPNTQITLAETIAEGTLKQGGNAVAEHCRVTGKMHERTSPVDGATYAIGFEMRLPKAWNGRFLHQGNGGTDGAVLTAAGALGGGPVTGALHQGFAVLSSDAGHSGGTAAFGIDPQARLDYGYQAVAKLTPMAKEAIKLAYGKGPDRSYFAGCSNGGRHGMVAATRYYADYDGVLAGAPGYNLPKAAVANLAGARLYQTVATTPVTNQIDLATAVTDTERQLLANRVVAKCDALDGATDGMVQDVAACQASFKLADDVPTCSGARDGSCLSSAQKSVLSQIFSGPTTSKGDRIYASFPYDGGFGGGRAGVPTGGSPVGSGVALWEFFISISRDAEATGLIFGAPPQNLATFNPLSFALTTDIDALNASMFATSGLYSESAMSFMTPPKPTQMHGLRNRGGKIMVYHGVSDAIFSVNDTETWFKGVQTDTGYDFARFYRVPGMGHCSGGPATDQFDMLTPLVNWVEKGQAPAAITASARGAGNAGGVNSDLPAGWAADRSRPLCPYPQVARYKGTGSLELASSFSCQ